MMTLSELSSAEIAFLTAPSAPADDFQLRLTRKLAATLTARLRLPVQATVQTAGAPADAPAIPDWQPDAALATLWLTRRLGGQCVAGVAPFVPPTLIHTLNGMLAECWLDATAVAAPPPAMWWHLITENAQATLNVQLPPHQTDMTRWARGEIRHG